MKKTLFILLLLLAPLLSHGQNRVDSTNNIRVVVTIHHWPTPNYTIFHISDDYTLMQFKGFSYRTEDRWNDTIASTATRHLSTGQFFRIVRSATEAHALPPDSTTIFDGNRYHIEYRADGETLTHTSSFDTPDSLIHFLYSLFEQPGTLYVSGTTGQRISDTLGCYRPEGCWTPMPVAQIRVLDPQGYTVATTLSDGRGFFDFDLLPGRYTFAISHPGFDTLVIPDVDLFDNLELPDLTLQPTVEEIVIPQRPKVAVVLSGGGAKGVAHISALRAIEQAGIPIDIITGTSMGSLIGGLYAIGWSTDQLDSLVRTQNWSFLLTDRARPEALDIESRRLQSTYPLWHAFSLGNRPNEGAGVIRGLNLDRLFERLLEGYLDSISFDSLPIPFACVATDVITNTEVDFRSGYLKQAMRASMSIPGVFSPVRMGDRLLVDGGLRNNYPADIARQMGADIIIGVTVQGDTLSADDINGPIELFMQVIDINCKNKYSENIALSDLVMYVDVSGYSAASFNATAIDTLLRRGAEEAARHSSRLKALADSIGAIAPVAEEPPAPVVHTPKTTRALTPVPYPLLSNPLVGVTFRFDTEEMGALQIGAQLPFAWHFPMQVATRLRLGKRLQFSAEHRIYPRGITSPSSRYTYQRNDIDIYQDGVRSYNIKYNQHTFQLTPLNSFFRLYQLRAGIRFDYYDYYHPILSSGTDAIVLDNQRYYTYFFESLLNTENDLYFPTTGTRFYTSAAYHTDNLATINGTSGLLDLSLSWRINIAPSDRSTFRPSLFARMLFGDQLPIAFTNVLGSSQSILEQQIHFPGVHSLVRTERHIVGAQIASQHLIARNQYILLHIAAARHLDDINNFLHSDIDLGSSEFIYGASVGYAYSSFLGPIQAHLGYSTLSPGIHFYLSIGHQF